jgi:hypothetical protein
MAQQAEYFKDFSDVIISADATLGLFNAVPGPILWTFMLNTTTNFVGMIIRGELPNTKETEDAICALLMHGMDGVLAELEKNKCNNKQNNTNNLKNFC